MRMDETPIRINRRNNNTRELFIYLPLKPLKIPLAGYGEYFNALYVLQGAQISVFLFFESIFLKIWHKTRI
uniref:Uncharacterized protein n=1 Tax=Anguilla anguilla TaxID=7936 RepID=A0A0E9SJ39_ANGAN